MAARKGNLGGVFASTCATIEGNRKAAAAHIRGEHVCVSARYRSGYTRLVVERNGNRGISRFAYLRGNVYIAATNLIVGSAPNGVECNIAGGHGKIIKCRGGVLVGVPTYEYFVRRGCHAPLLGQGYAGVYIALHFRWWVVAAVGIVGDGLLHAGYGGVHVQGLAGSACAADGERATDGVGAFGGRSYLYIKWCIHLFVACSICSRSTISAIGRSCHFYSRVIRRYLNARRKVVAA